MDLEKDFEYLCGQLFSATQKAEVLILTLEGESSQFIRFNHSAIRQTGLVDEAHLGLRLIRDRRTCTATVTLGSDRNENLRRGSRSLARLRTEMPHLPEDPYLVMPGKSSSIHAVQRARGLDPGEAVAALVPAMAGVDLVGIWAAGRIFRGVANSRGQRHWFEADSYSLDYSLVTPDHKMVKGTLAGTDWDQEAYQTHLANSRGKLQRLRLKPVAVQPGQYRTWFEPAAVAALLAMFSWNGISEAAIRQGSSGFGRLRRVGARLSPHFTLAEDFSSGLVPRFNSDGEVARERLPLISSGRLTNTLVSSRTASEYGVESNYAAEGEYLRAPRMEPGKLELEQILGSLDTGLYLSNLHYLNWSDTVGGRITGLTRYACFWVEKGELVGPLETMRFDDTLHRFLGSQLEAVSSQTERLPEVDTYQGRQPGHTECPGILVNNFTLTL